MTERFLMTTAEGQFHGRAWIGPAKAGEPRPFLATMMFGDADRRPMRIGCWSRERARHAIEHWVNVHVPGGKVEFDHAFTQQVDEMRHWRDLARNLRS